MELVSNPAQESRALFLSTNPKESLRRGLVFTAYGSFPEDRIKAENASNLQIRAIPNITGYIEQTSPFCNISPQMRERYRFLVTEDSKTQKYHNYYRVVVLRPLVQGEATSFGFASPETFHIMVSIAYSQEPDPLINSISLKHDFDHLKTIDHKVLERWIQ